MEQKEDNEYSVVMAKLNGQEASEAVEKKVVNTKAIAMIAGLAIVGLGGTYLIKKKNAAKEVGPMADTSSVLQDERSKALGYTGQEAPFSLSDARTVGVEPDTGSVEEKMKRLQEEARQNAGSSGGPSGNGPMSQNGGSRNQNQNNGGEQFSSRNSGGGNPGPSAPVSIIPAELRIRMQPEYEQWIQSQSVPAVAYSRSENMQNASFGAANQNAQLPGVDPALMNLTSMAGLTLQQQNLYLPAGSEITCVTDHIINTDYPGAIRATVIGPQELKGSKLIVNASGVTMERANASIGALVVNRGGVYKQYTVDGQIRTDLPALNGIVNRHIARRILPVVANAGIAGGALYLSGSSDNSNISTQDQIYGSMVGAGLSGIQTEIAKINEGKPPITVVVPAGQEFNILLVNGLEIK